jgi:mannose-6-phosphate isomerase
MATAPHWYPLRLSAPSRPLVFGGRRIRDALHKPGLPDWAIGETWECSDVDGFVAVVQEGALAGSTLRDLVEQHGEELVGRGWSGSRFPLLTKFIDASGALPVHLHADDANARRLEGQENGKTEAWHILEAAPGATALCGVREGVTDTQLREALLAQDFDAVLRRLPVRAGETIYVPGGTPHSFGPDTLIFEIEQTSNIQQQAMRWSMSDGSSIEEEEWRAGIDRLVEQADLDARPDFTPGLRLAPAADVEQVFLTAGPYFALERWRSASTATIERPFATAQLLSNVGAAVTVRCGDWTGALGPGESLLLPAPLGTVRIEGPADVLFGYVPDLMADVVSPLAAGGYAPQLLTQLGVPESDLG